MEIEDFKSAWQKQPVAAHALVSPSRSLQFLRTSRIHDLQRSYELSRAALSLLFALLLVGVSLEVMATGAGRIAAGLFAVALLADGITGIALLARRWHEPAATTLRAFLSWEHRQLQTRLRFERYSRRLMFVLAAIALACLILGPRPLDARAKALDIFSRMALGTSFLAVMWRRTKSRSGEERHELERYLKDLQE